MPVINVESEVGVLKRVLLHKPGGELLNLTPETLEELLFDDIPYLKVAQKEHDDFAKVLAENGAEVVYLENLMAETLQQNPGLREDFLNKFLDEAGLESPSYKKEVFNYLDAIKDEKNLVLKTMAGISVSELEIKAKSSIMDYLQEPYKLVLKPMPNLYFTRDQFASVGSGIVLNKMFSTTRNRETIYADYIFKYHSDYKNTELLYNRNEQFHIEGGDVLNLTDTVLAIGISQRTQASAIEQLAKNIFYNSSSRIQTILAFHIPVSRAFMHLDTVFTQLDKNVFTIHPAILDPLKVFEITKSQTSVQELKIRELFDKPQNILAKYLGCDKVDLILCGGGDIIAAEREQWNDGSNTLCIKPGTVVVYERNEVTNELMREKGINLIEMESSELSRGRGGPRCMSMPLLRESI